MPHRTQAAQPVTAADQPAETQEAMRQELSELKAKLAAVSERTHNHGSAIMANTSAEKFAERLAARAPPPPQSGPDLPPWMKFAASLGGLILMGIGIFTFLSNQNESRAAQVRADAAVAAQIASLVAWRAEWQGLPNRVQSLESQNSTAGRIQTQIDQGQSDRLRVLELSDNGLATKMSEFGNSIAGMNARIEEMLRRQERLENQTRLIPGLQRNDAPADAFLRGRFDDQTEGT